MGVFVQLKKVLEKEDNEVGVKAKHFALLEKTVKLPFSLVITSEVFQEFIKHNELEEKISMFKQEQNTTSLIHEFAQLSSAFKKATFPSAVTRLLRECFELVCLDTGSINTLLPATKESNILCLRRSLSYEDADTICPGVLFTKDDFEEFIDHLKSCFLSAFAPSSVRFREKKKIVDFSLSVILSKVPTMYTSLQASLAPDAQTIFVQSYVGFPDLSRTIPRDEFTLSSSFLKIVDAKIKTQNTVTVFDLATNSLEKKHYITKSSSQSAPDQTIQEAGRVAKKIQAILEHEKFSCLLLGDKNNNVYLLDIFYDPSTPQKEDEKKEQECQRNQEQPPKQRTPAEEGKNRQEEKDIEEQDKKKVEKEGFFSDEQTISLARQVQFFLEKNKQGELSSSIDVLLRSLENEVSKQSLVHGLLLCKELIDKQNDR